jgi:hypothetical protein
VWVLSCTDAGSLESWPARSARRSGHVAEPDLQAIGRLLGLERSELSWLDALPPAAQRELRAALEQPADGSIDRAVAHTFAVMGHRSRTFAFVGYPAVNDRRSVCDGLLPE